MQRSSLGNHFSRSAARRTGFCVGFCGLRQGALDHLAHFQFVTRTISGPESADRGIPAHDDRGGIDEPGDLSRLGQCDPRVLESIPIRGEVGTLLGQEFGGYAANVAHATKELERTSEQLHELNLMKKMIG